MWQAEPGFCFHHVNAWEGEFGRRQSPRKEKTRQESPWEEHIGSGMGPPGEQYAKNHAAGRTVRQESPRETDFTPGMPRKSDIVPRTFRPNDTRHPPS